MPNSPYRDEIPLWPTSRLSGMRARALVFVGLVLLALVVLGSVKLIADETIRVEERSHVRRQFQLGGILAGHGHEAVQLAVSPDGTAVAKATRPEETSNVGTRREDGSTTALGALSWSPVKTATLSETSTRAMDGPTATGMDEATQTGHLQNSSHDLLQALSDALAKVINASAVTSGTESTKAVELPTMSGSLGDAAAAAASSQASLSVTSASQPTGQPSDGSVSGGPLSVDKKVQSSTGSHASPPNVDMLIRLFSGLVRRDSIQRGGLQQRAQLRARSGPSAPSEQVFSLLKPLSAVVAQLAGMDAGAAAKLTDAILGALPVDASAVASIVPQVAEQASVGTADVLPLIIPAISAVLGKPLEQSTPVGLADLPGALRNVVEQGTTVINQITTTMRTAMGPEIQVILKQVAIIVYAAADRLDEPLCAISQNIQGVPLEVVVPCSSAGEGPVSVNVITLNPKQAATGSVHADSSSWNIIPAASGQAYDAPQSPPAAAASPAPTADTGISAVTGSTSEDAGTGHQTDGARQSGASYGQAATLQSPPGTPLTATNKTGCETSVLSSPTPASGQPIDTKASGTTQPTGWPVEDAPCPTCPLCDECPRKPYATPSTTGGRPDGASSPCPGRGFNCSECLDGWFCPPQETPAQVVPCGLGWPCFHCKSGWFCTTAREEVPAWTSPPPTRPADGTSTSDSTKATPTGDTASEGSGTTHDWGYLGCFQDAINRTLIGSKPLDYVRSKTMCSSECIQHCMSKGYSFAGTEYGKECWCGVSIRDDGVRLPESFCNMGCQGADEERCGGSWAISVFTCSKESGRLPDSGPRQGPELPPTPAPAQQASKQQPAGQTATGGQPLPAQPTAKAYGPVAQLLFNEVFGR